MCKLLFECVIITSVLFEKNKVYETKTKKQKIKEFLVIKSHSNREREEMNMG